MDKRTAKQNYKLELRPMGVFQILCNSNGKMLIDSSLDMPGKINRHRFQLNAGVHPNKALQADWQALGEEAFEFEILESVEPRPEPGYDHASDVQTLEELWLEKLEPFGERGYNIRKKTREERLRMIAANRNS